jgi:hypothetical protein
MDSLMQPLIELDGGLVKIKAVASSMSAVRQIEIHYALFVPNIAHLSEKEIGEQDQFREIELPVGDRDDHGLSKEAYELILVLQNLLADLDY